MAQYDRMAVLNAIYATSIVPVFYNKDPETTINIVEACARGGARVAEAPRRVFFGIAHRGPADGPSIEADAPPRLLVDARVHEEV